MLINHVFNTDVFLPFCDTIKTFTAEKKPWSFLYAAGKFTCMI